MDGQAIGVNLYPNDEHDHGPTAQLLDTLWCLTCEHSHIATIPVTTFRCASNCGFGCWAVSVAEAHATNLPDHIVYPQHHQMVHPRPAHILTVTALYDGTIEYEIEHPGCSGFDVQAFDMSEDGHTVEANTYGSTRFDCGVDMMISEAGFLDALCVTSWGAGLTHVTEHLAPGRYEVDVWSTTYPSTPNGPAEYDAGLTVEPITEDSTTQQEEVTP